MGVTQGQRTHAVVRDLFDLVPQCVLQPHEFIRVAESFHEADQYGTEQDFTEPISRYLLQLLADCLKGLDSSLQTAEWILQRLPRWRYRSFEIEAAWDAFLRWYETSATEELRDFAVTNYWSFRTPELLSDFMQTTCEISPSSPLANAQVLACRHLLGSTVAELSTIRSILPGLRFSEVVGKPYSANRAAVLELERRGFSVDRTSTQLAHRSRETFGRFEQTHRSTVRAAVERLIATAGDDDTEPLLVIDDGGALINAVGQAVLKQRIRRPVVAVEQTTRGVFAVRSFLKSPIAQQYGFAIINVAESYTKLLHETPIIAKSVVNESLEWLQYLAPPASRRTESLRFGVVGYGTVGAHVAAQLSDYSLNVRVYDRSLHKTSVASASRIPIATSIGELLELTDVVICASNGTSISTEVANEHLRDGTVIISASSGDGEVRGLHDWPIETGPLLPDSNRTYPFDEAHGLLTARGPRAEVYVANGGFPVNFDGSIDPIKPDLIQVTRSLIVAAVLQAASAKLQGPSIVGRTGEFDLDDSLQESIVERFRRLSMRAD